MGLPGFLRPFFWDVHFARLDQCKDRHFIVARIAEFGTDRAIRWLRSAFSAEEIAQSLEKARSLVSPRTISLWRLWLEKPEDWCAEVPSRPLKGIFWKS